MILDRPKIVAAVEAELAHRLDQLPESKTFAAAQWAVELDGLFEDGAAGVRSFESRDPVSDITPFDLASVTKIFTATLALMAFDRGVIQPWTPVSDFFELEGDSPTILDLMNHSSGLPAWEKYYEKYPMRNDLETVLENRERILRDILEAEREPPGENHAYSDLGYILLGRILEQIYDSSLASAIRCEICEPLGLESIDYVSVLRGDQPIATAAATEYCETRGKPVVGEVHDENTWIQGGVAGHAGLFGTASDLHKFGSHLLSIYHGADGILTGARLRWAWSDAARGAGRHVAGWDTPSGKKTSVGRGFGRNTTFGHLGFTGTSLWIDVEARCVAALLTNRVYPTRENSRILDARIAFHESVLEA